MMSLWTLFVVEVFGSFWSAVIGLSIIMYIILVLGGTSQDSCLTYIYIFIMIMAAAYASILIAVLMTVIYSVLLMLIIPRIINRGSQ